MNAIKSKNYGITWLHGLDLAGLNLKEVISISLASPIYLDLASARRDSEVCGSALSRWSGSGKTRLSSSQRIGTLDTSRKRSNVDSGIGVLQEGILMPR